MNAYGIFRRTGLLGATLVCLLALAVTTEPSLAAAELGQPTTFDIAPQQLPSALLKFSEQSGVQVTSPGELIEGKSSPGVVGTFNPSGALALLLKDTSLYFDVIDAHTVVISGPRAAKSSRRDLQKISNAGNAPVSSLADGQRIRLAAGANADAAAGAGAPANSARDADNTVEEVVITGTSIKRINAETALPVQVMKREEIARTGATTVEELFRQISAASSSGNTTASQGTGFQTGGISTISLRGLGSGRTLVLINGRRSAVYGGGSAGVAGSSVDIGAIPVAAIERVEILKDGASAVYGSDAIAGVVNFILRSNYNGAEVTATAGTPTSVGGGTQENVSGYAGLGDLKVDRYNAAFGFEYQHIQAILGRSRPFATRYSPGYGNDVTSGFAFPANALLPNGTTRSPGFPDCGPNSLNDVNFPGRCRFDNSKSDSLQPDQKKYNGNFNGSFALTDNAQLFAEASFTRLETLTSVQPVPLSFQNPLLPGNPYIPFLANLLTKYPGSYVNNQVAPGDGAFLLPPTSPYYPAAFAAAHGILGQPLNLIYRDFANGDRLTRDTADTTRVVGGLKGVAAGWDYETSVLYSEVQVKENLLSGFPLYSQIMPLLDSGNINPFGQTTDPAELAAARAAEFRGQDFSSKTSITSIAAKGSRELLTLPAGPLSGAAGVEWRRETFDFNPAAAIQTGDISGQGGNQLPQSASRSVKSAFVELNAVVVKGLEVDGAVRYDNYQGIGSTVDPKLSLRWQPEPWVLLRGSAGKGFRAPSLTDLYAAQATSVTGNGTRDPIKCAVFDPNNPACSFQFTTITGGNPNLKPEKSDTFTLGAVFEPVKDLSVDLDYFWIFLKSQIVVGGLNYATILQNAQTATQFAALINRDANGNIVSISQTNANLFKAALNGLDIDLKYGLSLGQAGRLNFLGNGTYFFKYDAQNADGSYSNQLDRGLTETSATGGVISRWRYAATIDYQLPSWDVSVTQNFQKGYLDVASSITNVTRHVSPYDTLDGQLSYLGLKSFRFTLGAKNMFNKVPPYANYAASANNFVGGYDLSYGDPRGAYVYLTATYTMH